MGFSEFMEQAEQERVLKRRLAERGVVDRSTGAALSLWMVTGWVGGHRYYLRRRGWLMTIWFLVGFVGLTATFEPGSQLGSILLGCWFVTVLVWWGVDAAFIGKWTGSFQSEYSEAERKLLVEEAAKELTVPFLRAAQRHGGKLTVTQASMATGLGLEEAELCLVEMSRSGHVDIENTDDGNLLFCFGDLPEFDTEEALREAHMEGQALAMEEMQEALEHEAEEAHKEERRSETRTATKTGVAAGIAMVAARALMGALDDGDDE